MEKSKYYTPTIDEFYVGFEYETLPPDSTEWRKRIYSIYVDTIILNDSIQMKGNMRVRVKYLDREDILSLGWVEYKTDKQWWYTKGDYRLFNDDLTHRVHIELYIPEKDGKPEWTHRLGTSFAGTIKNKSELKTLLKQLSIYV